MADKDLLEQWKRIEDPKEALAAIVEHEGLLGYDPYFKDLRNALIEIAERCSK